MTPEERASYALGQAAMYDPPAHKKYVTEAIRQARANALEECIVRLEEMMDCGGSTYSCATCATLRDAVAAIRALKESGDS